jgi:hypothetical protein
MSVKFTAKGAQPDVVFVLKFACAKLAVLSTKQIAMIPVVFTQVK